MVTHRTITNTAMMRKDAKGDAAPLTRDLHSEPSHSYSNMNHGQQARITRGAEIASKPNQIVRVDDTTYTVRSQSSNKVYELMSTEHGWICSCPDHMYRGVCCKHIHAVEISKRMREAVQQNMPKTVIPQVDLGRCKFCDSANIVKHGIKKLKKGNTQRFKCMDCKRHFTNNLGFERKHATPEQITTAVDLLFSGLSSRKVAQSLEMMGIKTSYVTIQNWAKEYAGLMEKYLDKITPQVGEQWRTDEIYLKIKGERKYLFAMLDSETRFWLAKMVATHKGNDDVIPMFKQAKTIAGKVPEQLTSDGAANFAHAHKRQYAAKNFLHKESTHNRHIHLAGDMNNNQMESFNGNTIRHREKVTRGLKREDSSIISGLRIYHNYIRPHMGLNGKTPAEAAGIQIQGNNKILTMIQAAAKSNTG